MNEEKMVLTVIATTRLIITIKPGSQYDADASVAL